jgi:hypothetical protein
MTSAAAAVAMFPSMLEDFKSSEKMLLVGAVPFVTSTFAKGISEFQLIAEAGTEMVLMFTQDGIGSALFTATFWGLMVLESHLIALNGIVLSLILFQFVTRVELFTAALPLY